MTTSQKRYSTAISVGGLRVEHPPDPIKQVSKAAWLANSIFCPLGPMPTQAWFLMTYREARNLSKSSPININWTQTLTTSDDGAPDSINNLTFKNFYLVKSERVFQGGVGDLNALHLVELADARLIAARNSDSGSIRMNLRSYANSADYLAETANRTWDNLVSTLWIAAGGPTGLLGNYPGLPFTPDSQPENTWLIGLNAWRALTAVLDQLDCAVAHDPFAGTYRIVQLGNDNQDLQPDNTASLVFDGEPITPQAVQAAAKLNIYYYYHRKSYGQERDTEVDNNWAYNGEGIIDSINTGINGAVGALPLWDDLPIILDETGNQVGSNYTAQQARTAARKARYVLKQAVQFKHRVHAELSNSWLPGGQTKAVLWRNWGDGEQNDLGGSVTEYLCAPDLVIGFKPSLAIADPAAKPCAGYGWVDFQLYAPERENYAPSDLGRHTYPCYPRLPNIVQVAHTDADPGVTVTANADNLHPGKVRRWVNGTLETLEDCWILFVDEYDTKLGAVSVKNADCFGAARLSGVKTSGAAQLPIYLVRAGGATAAPSNIIVFQLYGQLALAGEALAKLCLLNNLGLYAATTTIVTVVDPYFDPGCWSGEIGYRGLAKERTDSTSSNPRYDIIWMERYALITEGLLTSNNQSVPPQGSFPAIPGSATATNLFSFQQGDKDPGNAIVINDPLVLYPRALTGANSLGIRDDKRGQYNFLVSQQQCFLASATLNQQSFSADNTQNIAINNFLPANFSPFNLPGGTGIQANGTGLVRNDWGCFGESGNKLVLVWVEAGGLDQHWSILQVQYNFTDVTRCVQVKDTSKSAGALVKYTPGNPVPGLRVNRQPGFPLAQVEAVRQIWIDFMDFRLTSSVDNQLFATNYQIYGPARWVTILNDGRPLYECSIGVQEWWAKLDTDVNKGDSNLFTLYNRDKTTSGYAVTAECTFNPYKNGKWAIVERMLGTFVANQIER